jgi:hypothetical protein
MRSLWTGLAFAAVGILATCSTVKAQQPYGPPLYPPPPPPMSSHCNVIQSSANGFGNAVIVGNSGCRPGSCATVITNSRNGVGNRVVIVNNGQQLIVDDTSCYHGRNNVFWSTQRYCDPVGCSVYYCPQSRHWYRYVSAEDCYRPVPQSWNQMIEPGNY